MVITIVSKEDGIKRRRKNMALMGRTSVGRVLTENSLWVGGEGGCNK